MRVQSSEAVTVQRQVAAAALVASEALVEEVGRTPVVRTH